MIVQYVDSVLLFESQNLKVWDYNNTSVEMVSLFVVPFSIVFKVTTFKFKILVVGSNGSKVLF